MTFGFVPGHALVTDLTFTVHGGEVCALVGPSGTGKSTLLGVISGVVSPQSGSIRIEGHPGDRPTFCWITQGYNSLPHRSVLDNASIASMAAGSPRRAAELAARAALASVGLENRVNHRASQLSGGELQRVAVARAIASNSPCLLADEPTGNLDRRTSADVVAAIVAAARAGRAVVVATHDQSFRDVADAIIDLAEVRDVAAS